MPKENKIPEGAQGRVIGSAEGASGKMDSRDDSKRSPDYKGVIKQKDNGIEAVYDRRNKQ